MLQSKQKTHTKQQKQTNNQQNPHKITELCYKIKRYVNKKLSYVIRGKIYKDINRDLMDRIRSIENGGTDK